VSAGERAQHGRLIGVGVGPGDPELATLKAARTIASADVIAHFAKAGRASHARATAAGFIKPGTLELPLLYPVTTEIARHDPAYDRAIQGFFDASADAVAEQLERGRCVAVLSEGDPLFYGSYMHLHVRLAPRYPTEVIPGVTSLSGCWSEVGLPIAQGDDVLTVVPATLEADELARRFAASDAVAVMKIGRHLAKVRRALADAGRLAGAIYVENGTTAQAHAVPLAEKPDDRAPYFAVVLVAGWRGTP
jgi:precorrin-2/cobalt-factor-2 C20-methyltransferase